VTILPGSLRTVPLTARAGSRVVFRATIKNVGAAPTPDGVIHGVAFLVDGDVISWSDTSSASLAPGATRTLSANWGPLRRAAWNATSGTHVIEAIWDDVARLEEANEANNTMTRRITVRSAPAPALPRTSLYLH
jgi:subtilase family serine protease